MSAIGLKCIVAGNEIGGIVLSKEDHQQQLKTNYNSNYWTHSNDLEIIYKKMNDIITMFEDVKGNKTLIEEEVAGSV